MIQDSFTLWRRPLCIPSFSGTVTSSFHPAHSQLNGMDLYGWSGLLWRFGADCTPTNARLFRIETAQNNSFDESCKVCKVFMIYHMDVSNADDLVVVVGMKPNSTWDTSRSLARLISHSPVLIVSIFVKERVVRSLLNGGPGFWSPAES